VNRRGRIVALLEHLPEYYALGQPGNAGTGSDSNIGRFRLAEHPSVRELYRCLMLLRQEHPLPYKHLKSFYLAETRIARVRRRSEVPRELRDCTPVRCTFEPRGRCYAFRQSIVPSWVQTTLVDAGVDYLEQQFRGEPCLPSEFMGELGPLPSPGVDRDKPPVCSGNSGALRPARG